MKELRTPFLSIELWEQKLVGESMNEQMAGNVIMWETNYSNGTKNNNTDIYVYLWRALAM